jgi:hypothetical protein
MMVKKTKEEITNGEPESPLKGGLGYHYLVGFQGGDPHTLYQSQLEDGSRRKKVVHNQFLDHVLIDR